ncbi:MAG TPA: lactate utilization protein B [Phycisphaerae bacterium]|nr:lactate utilization protein B [Phycisphaerae bacterium]
MWNFRDDSRDRVADTNLADKLQASTGTSLAKAYAIMADMPHWQQLRERAREVKLHTLTHLDRYLDQFVKAAQANGATVTWADTGAEACNYVVELARRHRVSRITKAKSMTGEEIEINHALLRAGIEPVETDFGEMVCQLAGQAPSHVTAPIIQWSIEEVARLLKDKGIVAEISAEIESAAALSTQQSAVSTSGGTLRPGLEALAADSTGHDEAGHARRIAAAAKLVAAARTALREKFLTAGMGISGANFAVAESGTIVLIENEANIRLSTTLPPVHVAIVGIEKLIPRLADLGTFLSLLPVVATGQRQSGYVSLFHRPFGELHIVLLDNGRSRLLADKQHYDILSCIRCGACMNVCPVYRLVSGHGYNSIYPGPIGCVLTPHLRSEEYYRELPFASSLCGACAEICPVGIPLADHLLEWRDRIVAQGGRPRSEAAAFAVWAWLMQHPGLYRAGRPPAAWMEAMAGMFGPIQEWKATRDMPPIAAETFAKWWERNRASSED